MCRELCLQAGAQCLAAGCAWSCSGNTQGAPVLCNMTQGRMATACQHPSVYQHLGQWPSVHLSEALFEVCCPLPVQKDWSNVRLL